MVQYYADRPKKREPMGALRCHIISDHLTSHVPRDVVRGLASHRTCHSTDVAGSAKTGDHQDEATGHNAWELATPIASHIVLALRRALLLWGDAPAAP